MRWIYLDYNATTPLAPAVQEALLPFLAERYGAPTSSHMLGRACQEALEDARSRVALLVDADRDEIIFTSGGTEANNLALCGVLWQFAPQGGGHVVISALEHESVSEPAHFLERMGHGVSIVHCNRQGLVDPAAVADALRPETVLVSVQHANHELGVVQPVREIAQLCHAHDILVHTDAAQSVGKIPVSVEALEVDLLSLSGHKFYAPKGVGALFVRRGVALEPLLHGAGHEGGLRSGTQNVAGIVGLGRAASIAQRALGDSGPHLANLRDRLLAGLRHEFGPDLLVHGEFAPRLPNTLCVSLPHTSAADLLARTPELCAFASTACHPHTAAMSPSLAAIGLSMDDARRALRFSVGWYTTEEEIDRAISLIAG